MFDIHLCKLYICIMSATSSVGQRFLQLIQALGMSKNAFAISLDKTATVIQHLVDERNKPGFDLMNKVVDVYPNVSIEWLLRGKGPMMLDSTNASATQSLVPEVPTAPTASKPAPATPSFPTPLFAVATARQPAPVVPPLAAEMPPAEPIVTVAAAAPQAPVQEAPPVAASQPVPGPAAATVPPEPSPAVLPAQSLPAGPSATAAPAAAPADAAYLTAALHAQHLQHQLALAEQRNQHLLAQQKLILERQALMQQMLDLMRRPI
jgi:hypothetical protein